MARIIAEVILLQQKASRYLVKYEVNDLSVNDPTAGRDGAGQEDFWKESRWIEKFKEARGKLKNPHRIVWALQDRDDLAEILGQLRSLNEDLWGLTRATQADAVRDVTHALSRIGTDIERLTLQKKVRESPGSLLAVTAELQRLQEVDIAAAAEVVVRLELITLSGSTIDGKDWGFYKLSENGVEVQKKIWVEWKEVSATNPSKDEIIIRIGALAMLLSIPGAPEFHRPHCLGIFDDKEYERDTKGDRRIALVYERPDSVKRLPVSLARLIADASKSKSRPALGQRFQLAFKLASAMSLLHAANWLHKNFRSESILFESADMITTPLIGGFQYSRPRLDVSLESLPHGKPEVDFYYHPEVGKGWSKVKDIYSLGVVLWEVANWRPAFEDRFRKMRREEVSACLLKQLDGDEGRVWDGLVGKTYMDVVRICLKGDFGVVSGNSDAESKILSAEFFAEVLSKLEMCKA